MAGKRKLLTVADLIVPGDILQILRDTLAEAHSLDVVIVVTVRKGKPDAVEVTSAGTASEFEVAGYLHSGILTVLTGEANHE